MSKVNLETIRQLRERNAQLLVALRAATQLIHEQLMNAYNCQDGLVKCRQCLRVSPLNPDRTSCKVVHDPGCRTGVAIKVEQLAEAAISAAKGKQG